MGLMFSKIRFWHWLIAVILLSLIPFPTTKVPEWHLLVVDKENRPIVGANVELSWHDYDYFQEGLATVRSDESGKIVFPARILWGNIMTRIGFPLLAKLSILVHGSTGYSIFVRVYDTDLKYVSESSDQIHWYSKWDSDKPLPTKIVGSKQLNWNPL